MHFMLSIFFPLAKNRAGYEAPWKNITEPERPKMTI